jgi:predicted phage terminase large subunit-like protein
VIPQEFRVLLRRDFASFIEASFSELNPQTPYAQSSHIDVMASKLAACARGECRRLIINLPPRSLKSHSASVAFPAWLLGQNPSTQLICVSYGQELADKHARDTRQLMTTPFYRQIFPKAAISPERKLVSDFATTAGGVRMATSVGGVLTGRGADIIIIDDPLKPDEAMSETRRTTVNEWYDNSLLSRLNSKETGVIIVVMQRLHQDDLVGHLLEVGNWEVLSFPAIAEQVEKRVYDTPFGPQTYRRLPGDVLDSSRESAETLLKIKQTLGEYNFSAQYQQMPIPVGGAMIKLEWLRNYRPEDLPSEFTYTFQSWDTANKSGELNDYSVCTTWGGYDGNLYLLDVVRRRVNYPDLKRLAKQKAKEFCPSIILIEDKASGTQLIQDLREEGLYEVKPFTPPPNTDKIMRLNSVSAQFEAGKIHLPTSAPWIDEYCRELLTFPGVKHDDQVDSTTQAIEYTRTRRSIYDCL